MWTRLGIILYNISISLMTAIRLVVFIYICVCAVMMEGLSSSWSNAVILLLYAENNTEALGNAITGKIISEYLSTMIPDSRDER